MILMQTYIAGLVLICSMIVHEAGHFAYILIKNLSFTRPKICFEIIKGRFKLYTAYTPIYSKVSSNVALSGVLSGLIFIIASSVVLSLNIIANVVIITLYMIGCKTDLQKVLR